MEATTPITILVAKQRGRISFDPSDNCELEATSKVDPVTWLITKIKGWESKRKEFLCLEIKLCQKEDFKATLTTQATMFKTNHRDYNNSSQWGN